MSLAIGAAVGLAIFFVLDPLVLPLAERMTGSTLDLSQFAAVEGDAGEYMTLLIVGLLFGGIVEEVTFRGFFIGWGCKLFGKRSALPLVVLTAAVFGYGHWYQSAAGAILTGIAGLAFGLVYVICGRKLLPAITAHMVSNFCGITDIYLNGV
ncbi:MAG: CPBP family intramembrane glutamic endopeptidase [Pacificimonas sp.]